MGDWTVPQLAVFGGCNHGIRAPNLNVSAEKTHQFKNIVIPVLIA